MDNDEQMAPEAVEEAPQAPVKKSRKAAPVVELEVPADEQVEEVPLEIQEEFMASEADRVFQGVSLKPDEGFGAEGNAVVPEVNETVFEPTPEPTPETPAAGVLMNFGGFLFNVS